MASNLMPTSDGQQHLKVYAIVVLFHPGPDFENRLCKLRQQFAHILLIDNTSDGARLREMQDGVTVIVNARNVGVAQALNQGVAFALQQGFDWVATFDQDTEVLPGYLAAVNAVAQENGPDPVVVGVNYFDEHTGRVAHRPPSGASPAWPRLTLITSGSFFPAGFAQNIGGFREDFFIDSVDHEFCLRAQRHGARLLMTKLPYMRHCMGSADASLGIRLSLQHPPRRRYYIARNSVLTMRENFWRYPIWSLCQIGRLCGELVSIVVLESDVKNKLGAFLQGLWHGVIGRSGARE